MIEVRVLGPIEVRRDGRPVELRSARRTAILATLCARWGESVPVDVLVYGAWGDAPPSQARSTLQAHLSRLRDAVGNGVVQTVPGAYRLRRDGVRLDVDAFERLRSAAQAAVGQGRYADAAEHLASALGLWRGPAYGDLNGHAAFRPAAVRLEEQRVAAVEDWIEARLAIGPAGPLVADLELLCAEHPWRERPHLLLMRALAAAGRARDALLVGQDFRRRLAEHAGLQASAAVTGLESQIAAGEVRQAGPEGSPPPGPSPTIPGPDRRLLAPPTSFLGRAADVGAVEHALERSRVVTLCGVGGVGKTRLALEVGAKAEAFDVVWFASLAPVAADGVAHAVAGAVGAVPQRGESVQDAIVHWIGGRPALLVLDNCEHVMEPTARLASVLVDAAPRLRILATSRAPLDIMGEQVYEVRPLRGHDGATSPGAVLDSPAVALFAERARAVRADFAVDDDNVDAVVDICRRLDGLPLALEMAAARMRSMGPADLARRLDERFRILRGRRDEQETHHRNLESLLGWSYDLLGPGERRVLARTGVFGGSFDLDAAREVCALDDLDPSDVTEHLSALVDKSLVVAEHDQVRTRYRLLDTVRAFAIDRLTTGEDERLRDAHARYFVAWARRCSVRLAGPAEPLAVAEMNREFDNLRAVHHWALEAGRSDVISDLLDAVFEYELWRDRAECYDWARAAVERLRPDDPRLAGAFAYLALAAPTGTPQHVDALRRGLRLHEKRAVATDRCWPLQCALATEASLVVSRIVEQTSDVVLADEDGRGLLATFLLSVNSSLVEAIGDLDWARRLVDDLTARASALGAPTALALALSAEARLVREREPGRAEDLFERAVAYASAVGSRRLAASIFAALTEVRFRHGDPRATIAWLVDRWEDRATSASGMPPETVLTYLMGTCRRAGALEAAAMLLGAVEVRRGNRIASYAERNELSVARSALVRGLGGQRLDRALSAGRVLSDEAVSSLARAVARGATVDRAQSGKSAGE